MKLERFNVNNKLLKGEVIMKLQCQNRPAFYFGFAYYAFG